MTVATEEAWIDVMPAILLECGTPIVTGILSSGREEHGVNRTIFVGYDAGRLHTAEMVDLEGPPANYSPHRRRVNASIGVDYDARVDLSTANGFGRALRGLRTKGPASWFEKIGGSFWLACWLDGTTTEDDRNALAFAYREVIS